LKWKDLRFRFFDRNPQIFAAFEASLEELQVMVFDFSERKKYDLTRHALGELRALLAAYLNTRDSSLRVPTSAMALFFPSESGFDAVLTRQLERFKSHMMRGTSNSDQEFVKQVASSLSELALAAVRSRSYFPEHGESSVTTFVMAYLYGGVRDAAVRGLDDVAMEGADHLKDLSNALIDKKMYISALTPLGNLEELAHISILRQTDVVLSVAVRALSDCLFHNCASDSHGSHITSHILESLFRVTRARLASPLGLDGTKVSFSVGPFMSVTERSSFAAIDVALANAIANLLRDDPRKQLGKLRSSYEELHDRAWLDFAELGIDAVKKDSFLLHHLNGTVEEIIKASFWLLKQTDVPRLEETSWETASEQHQRDRFREEIRKKISWETTGIYSRIIPAMFENKKLKNLEETIELQCLFAFWAIRFGILNIAQDALERVFQACVHLQDEQYGDMYGSARLATHVAEIGAYAIASDADPVAKSAAEHYSALRKSFLERYPDRHFVGDFDSAEEEMLDERRGLRSMIEPHDQELYSKVTPEHIQTFFALLSDL
jgi:hypothetical protein